MLETIFAKMSLAVLAVVAGIAGIFNYSIAPEGQIDQLETQIEELKGEINDFSNISFGSYFPVAGGFYKLAGAGIGTTDTTIVLQKFTDPMSGAEMSMEYFGSIGYMTLEPGKSKKEFISFTGVTQDANSTEATLTGVSRGLWGIYPFTASSSLAKSHSGGSRAIISNPPQHYEKYANTENDITIHGDWTFMASGTPQYGAAPDFTAGSHEFADIAYVDAVATSGAANASGSVAGIVEIGSAYEIYMSSSSGSTGAPLVPDATFFGASSSAKIMGLVTEGDGKISQGFLDLTEDWTFTGTTIAMENLLVTSSTTLATTTFSSTIPTLPSATPTAAYEAVSKAYVDDKNIDKYDFSSYLLEYGVTTTQAGDGIIEKVYGTATSCVGFVKDYSSTTASGLKTVGFQIRKKIDSTLTGNIKIEIYDFTSGDLERSETFMDSADLTTNYEWYTYTFSEPRLGLNDKTRVVFCYNGGDASNYIEVYGKTADTWGNEEKTASSSGSWHQDDSKECASVIKTADKVYLLE